jgi:putative long chain acyl-CoA synthase
MNEAKRPKKKKRRKSWRRRLNQGAQNTLELMRLGRLTERQAVEYDVMHREASYQLRRYKASLITDQDRPALLLIPPLMLTAEIYDLAPDLSAVDFLLKRGIDPWVVDFGAPERLEHGMTRTLDDHVCAVVDAVRRVRDETGRSVHLAGYSQGGMFAYQAGAFLGSEGLASIVTFGSPVDIHRTLPRVSTDITARLIRGLRVVLEPPLRRIEGLPGVLTSTAFKLLSPKKELEQMFDFVTKLHDRNALAKRETRRRFLNGEGFVAWPGPALLKFIDEFIVHNRMMSGGFVVDGRTVTLADIRCPVLYFVGTRDEIARPAAVRAINHVVQNSKVFEAAVPAGHFGLVVGSTSLRESWPTVVEWLKWREGAGGRPRLLSLPQPPTDDELDDTIEVEDAAFDEPLEVELFTDALRGTAEQLWNKLGDRFEDIAHSADALRYQLPRLARLHRLEDGARVSFSRSLQRQAERIGDRTFFLWKGRAFSYADANRRVDAVVRGLYEAGVRPGQRVAVVMRPRPSFLSAVTALNRLGAVAALCSPDLSTADMRDAIAAAEVSRIIVDPDTARHVAESSSVETWALGGGGPNRTLPATVRDLESIDPERIALPDDLALDAGRAEDAALVFVTAGHGLPPRAARITNRRWAISAWGAAAAATLTNHDTVYCCLPLHHPSGLLVSVGAALVSGTRLALATHFDPETFWREVSNYGATVTFYAGEMVRELLSAPRSEDERRAPLRLMAGSAMRRAHHQRVRDRFGIGVLELYASTECPLVLANASGKKVGALGRPLPGSSEPLLLQWDFKREDFARSRTGDVMRAKAGRPGLLLARVQQSRVTPSRARVLSSVLAPGDAWFVTGDLLRQDSDGDYWFVERASEVIHTSEGPAYPREVEDVLFLLPQVDQAAVYAIPGPGKAPTVVASIVFDGEEPQVEALVRHLSEHLPAHAIPELFRFSTALPLTDGFRPIKPLLRARGDEFTHTEHRRRPFSSSEAHV